MKATHLRVVGQSAPAPTTSVAPAKSNRRAKATAAFETSTILAGIRLISDARSEWEYFYRCRTTGREFEIRDLQPDWHPTARTEARFFLSEMVPNGRVCVTHRGKLLSVHTDDRIAELESSGGPNGLMKALRLIGIPRKQLVLVGGGLGLDTVYLGTLVDCANAIAQSLQSNTRYQSTREPTQQELIQRARQAELDSYDYWEREAALLRQARTDERGIFSGCHGMLGPLSPDVKAKILAYLNQPTQAGWLAVRGLVITGGGTLWQAWCGHSASAPRSGSVGFPQADVLRQAIQDAIDRREAEIAERLSTASPCGLRAV